MTEQEAADFIKWLNYCGICTTGFCNECPRKQSKDMAISALEEIQQYRAIGTVEECQEAREKQKPMSAIRALDISGMHAYECGNCGSTTGIGDYCQWCGQRLE